MKYLITDCEMGGADSNLAEANFSLLSSYFGVVNDKGELIDELDLRLIPDDDIIILSQGGMRVNKIDIRTWDGMRYKEAKPLLYNFLAKNSDHELKNGRWTKTPDSQRMRLIGQRVGGDVKYITKYIISPQNWREYVADVPLDTAYVATFLRDSGLLPLASLSLKSLANYFAIDTTKMHIAKNDAIITWQVYTKLMELVKKNKE